MVLSLLAGWALLVPPSFSFMDFGPYDSAVPTPLSVLGYEPGDRVTNFRDQERVLFAIASATKDRVLPITYGSSNEGRPLRIFVVSSPQNMTRLDAIRAAHAKIAEGTADAATVKNSVPIVWVNECIHGNEPASFESAMYLLYNLAASESNTITDYLSKVVVIVNPVYNPDGHERFAVYYDSIATGSSDPQAYETSEPSLIHGRLNHYRFDMNRDRVAMSQKETKAEVAEFLKWNPQVYIDQHGQVSSYFFPPNPMSVNENVDRTRLNHWTDVFGKATAKAFDSKGFSYYVKDEFDLFYAGYLDSFTTLTGAIGMTHETDGGKELNRERPDGSILTLRHGVEKHFTSAMAVIGATAEHSDDLMKSYSDFKRSEVSGKLAGKFQRVVVLSDDRRPLARLKAQLASAGIRSSFNVSSFKEHGAHDYWSTAHADLTVPAHSLIIDMAQPQGALAKAFLEPTVNFEPEFAKAQLAKKKTAPEGETYPGPEGAEFYDITGWALPYAYNLRAWWCESVAHFQSEQSLSPADSVLGKSTIGYALEYRDTADILAAYDLLAAGIHAEVTTKPMRLAGRDFERGTFIFLSERNDSGLVDALTKTALARGARFTALTSGYPESDRNGPGSESVQPIKKPNIGIIFGEGANMADVGSAWFLMEQVFHLPFAGLSSSALGGDLSKYTCIVVPRGARINVTPGLKQWVQRGGSLIALGGIRWALGPQGFAELAAIKGKPEALPGALFKAQLDPRSFVSYGYGPPVGDKIEISAPEQGDTFFSFVKAGGSVVKFNDDAKASKLLSGWVYPDSEKNLAGTVWLQDVSEGRGHVLLFTEDPTERAMWPGLYKLFLNGILFGPG